MFVPAQIGKGHSAPIYDLVTDGKFAFTTAGDRYVVKWNLENALQEGFTIQLDSSAYVLELIDSVLYIGSTNGTITAIDTKLKRVVWEHNLFGKPWMAFTGHINKEENLLIAGDSAGNMVVLKAKSGDKVIHLPFACGRIRQIQCAENSIWLATQLEGIIQVDIKTMNEMKRFNPHQSSVNRILVKKNMLYSVGKDGHLFETNWINNANLKALPIHYQAIYGLIGCFDCWITCSMDKTIKIWDLNLEHAIQKIEGKNGGHKKSVNGIRKISENAFVSFSDDQSWILWRSKLTSLSWSEN